MLQIIHQFQGQAPSTAQPNTAGGSPGLLSAPSNPTGGSPGLLPAPSNPTRGSPGLLPAPSNPTGGNSGLLPVSSHPTAGGQVLSSAALDPTGCEALLQTPLPPTVGSPALLPAPPNLKGGSQGLLPAQSNPTAGSPALLPAVRNPTGDSPGLLPVPANPTGGNPGKLPVSSHPTRGGPTLLSALPNPLGNSPGLLPTPSNPSGGHQVLLSVPPNGTEDQILAPPNRTRGDQVLFPATLNHPGDSQVLLPAPPGGGKVSLLTPQNDAGGGQTLLSTPSNPIGCTQIVPNIPVGQISQTTSQISIATIPVDASSASKADPPGNPVNVDSNALSSTFPQLPQGTMEHQQQFGALEEDPFWPSFWSTSVPVSEISSSEAPINYSLAPMDLSTKQNSVSGQPVAEQIMTNVPEKSEDVKPKDEPNKTDGIDLKPEVTANTSAASEINASSGMSENSPAKTAVTLARTQDDNTITKEKLPEKVVIHQEHGQEQMDTQVSTSTEPTAAKSSTESPDSSVLPGIGDQSTSSGNISAKTTQMVPTINDVIEDDEASEFLVQQYLLQAYIKRLQNHQSLRRTRFSFPMAELLKSLDTENELNKASTDDCSPGNTAGTGKTTDENMNSGEFGFFSRLLQNYYNLQKEKLVLNEQSHRDKGSTSGQMQSSPKSQQEMEARSSSNGRKVSLDESLEDDLNAESLRSATSPRIVDLDQLNEERVVESNQQISHQQNQAELISHVTNEDARSQGSAKRNLETVGTKENTSEGESPTKKQKMSPANEAGGKHDDDYEFSAISPQIVSSVSHVNVPSSTNELPHAPSTVVTDTAVNPPLCSLTENQTVTQPRTVGVKATNQYSQGNSIKEILDEPDTTLKSPILLDEGVNANLHPFEASKEPDNPRESELQTQVSRQQVSAPTEVIELDRKLPQKNMPVANAKEGDSQRSSGSNNAATQTSDSEDVTQSLAKTSASSVSNVPQPEIPTTQQQTVVKMQPSEEIPQSFSTTAASQIVNVPQTQTVVRMKEVEDAAPSFTTTSAALVPNAQQPVQQQIVVKMYQNKAAPAPFPTTLVSGIMRVTQPQIPTVQQQNLVRMKEIGDTPPSCPTIQTSQIINVSLPQSMARKKQTLDTAPSTPVSQAISLSQPQTSIVQKPQTLVRMKEDALTSFLTASASQMLKQTKSKSVKRKSEVTREESPKNKSPKETIKKKWKLAPDSQQKEGITTRLRFQKDNQTKKVSSSRTPYTWKLRSAQAQLKEEETKEKGTYDAFWNENDEIIKEILSDSDSSDSNDSCSHESKVNAIVQGMDEEDMTKKKRKVKKNDEMLGYNRKVDTNDNIGDSEEMLEAKKKAGNPNQTKLHCEESGDLFSSQEKLDDHLKSHEGEKYCLSFYFIFLWTCAKCGHCYVL